MKQNEKDKTQQKHLKIAKTKAELQTNSKKYKSQR